MADLTLPVTRQCLTALSAPTVWMGSGRHSVAGPWAATDSRWPSQTFVELYDDSGSEFYYVDRTAIVPVQLKAPEQESGMTMTL